MKENKIFVSTIIVLLLLIVIGCEEPTTKISKIAKFKSGDELVKAFEEAKERGEPGILESIVGIAKGSMRTFEATTAQVESDVEYSETNIQVEGVDEADIIKTDGNYIYAVASNKLIIAKAYPADEAEILSENTISNFQPTELFIHNDRLLIFGYASYDYEEDIEEPGIGEPVEEKMEIMPYYPRYRQFMAVKLYDISDKEDIELLKTVDFEGNYLTSRKINEEVYFVVNSYPYYREKPICDDIVPLYRESVDGQGEMTQIARCVDIGYIEPIQASNFITIASISMTEQTINKEVIVGSGQNVFASLNNLYVAQTSWPRYSILGDIAKDYTEKTVITKFALDNGNIEFLGTGEVKGHILNQFSMDEYDDHFRIATTIGQVSRTGGGSTNNVYILDEELNVVGSLEDLAPGESIYSVRFMAEKGYVVTFKKVDPLFVIDLSDHTNPNVLGKLKIPGYSDYLHPYDEDHIIGIGKETVEAEEGDFAWYQGIKMAIFDVSDVENPIEMHKVVIGDRGTDSPILTNHKAFLFDREKELLVIPILLAEIKGEKSRDNQYGDYVFQGAYVYNINLDDGFELKGKVTHYDDDEIFKKSGYYFIGERSIQRSLYIEDALYTLSDKRLQLNDLDSLERLKILEFE